MGGVLVVTRVPLVSDQDADEVTASIFDGFAREGRRPIALYRALAHVPSLLRPYSVFARALRHEAVTDRRLRELVILRTAQLTESAYEWAHHLPMAARAGVPAAQLAALAAWEQSEHFDGAERAALRCAEEVHTLSVGDETFAALERALGRAGALEIVLTASFYQAVARTIQALDLEVEPEYRPAGEAADPARPGGEEH
jgi:alkylhydroperoxidase family enzyme